MSGYRRSCTVAACTSISLLLLAAGAASAATRYAAPGASGPEPCLQASPCSIFQAAQTGSVSDSDEVILLHGGTGSYALGATQLSITAAIDMHGEAGQAPPTLSGSAANLVFIDNAGAHVHDLRVESTGSNSAVLIFGGTVERVLAHNSLDDGCGVFNEGLLRDSVCWGDDTGIVETSGGVSTQTPKVRNVTAVGTGAGSSGIFMQTGFGANVTLDARNVIARGAQYDVFAEVNPPPGTAVVNLTTSNYATTQTSGASASITPAGTNGNQTAAPVFANATAGDFHELAGSPTVDAGSVDSLIGAADLDGMPRIIDATHRCDAPLAVPDIGAFELSTPAPSCPSVAPVGKATLGQIKRNKRRGTAIVPVIVPGPGSIGIAGKGVKPVSASALTAGTVKLLIKSAGKARARLRRAGAAKVAFTVTYAPNGGSASTESARVKLIRR